MKRKIKVIGVFLASMLYLVLLTHAGIVYLKQFTFNEDGALDRWGKMVLNGQVDYELMRYGSEGYVRAISDNACSALYYRIGFKAGDYPYLSWKWQVLKFPDLSKATTPKERDDYAARVYVIFPFLSFSSSKFLEYVWSEDLPEGMVMTSPKADNIKMIVIRSGSPRNAGWVEENRNVYDDYIRAFGKKPGLNVGAVAIMCNSDGTKSSAEALFDNMFIENKAQY